MRGTCDEYHAVERGNRTQRQQYHVRLTHHVAEKITESVHLLTLLSQ